MTSNKDYKIPFVGLKLGIHDFKFDVTSVFFEDVEYSMVEKGDLQVQLFLEKKETMMIGEYTVLGTVETICDRCSDPVNVEVEGNYRLIYKFDDQPSDDESLVVIFPEEYEIDVKKSILELITVSLPSRFVHDEGKCNREMLDLLEEYTAYSLPEDEVDEYEDDENNESIDPRWETLKKWKSDRSS